MYDHKKLGYFDQKTKQDPTQGDDTGTAEVINAGSGAASKVRHVQQSAHR